MAGGGSISGITFGTVATDATFEYINGGAVLNGTYPCNVLISNGTINFNGGDQTFNADITVNGGTLRWVGNSSRTHTVAGSLTVNSLGTYDATSGSGVPTINFTGTNKVIALNGSLSSTNHNINFNGSYTLNSNLPVATSRNLTVNGTLNSSANAITGAGTFTLSSGATLITANNDGINSSGSTGSIQTTGRSFSSGANYEFQGAAMGTFSTTPTANTVNNLTINTSGTINLPHDLTVSNTLTLTSGKLNLNGQTLTFNTISGIPAWGSSTTNYIVAESGSLSKTNPSSTIYPVGTTNHYMPCRITGTGSFGVFLDDPNDGLDPLYTLLKKWEISGSGTINVGYQWPAAVEGGGVAGVRDNLFLYRFSMGSWTQFAGPVSAAGSNPYSVDLTGISCCSGFAMGGPAALLPVELAFFHAHPHHKTTQLTWRTYSETNNAHFSIERSTDGQSYREIGRVAGQGTTLETTDYRFTDETPAAGINYYRLRQEDFDGQHEYSKVVSVRFDGGEYAVMVYPTVAKEELNIQFSGEGNDSSTITLFDLNGRLLHTWQVEEGRGVFTIPVSGLKAGHYFLKIGTRRGVETHRFVRIE